MQLMQSAKNMINRLKTAHSQSVASLYLLTFGLFTLVGACAALAMQLELWSASSTLFSGQLFARLLTQHGMVMTFVVLIPLIPAVLGNFILPSAVGSRDMAMRRSNIAGWFMHLVGAIAIVVAVELGAYDTGWTMNTPPGSSKSFQLLIVGLGLIAVSTLLLNLAIARIVLSRKYRTIPLGKLPVLAWFFLIGSLVVLIVSPVRIFTLALLSLHQFGHTPVFSLLDAGGIIRYEHLFWAYAGPATYAAVLPALGVTFEVLAACAGTPLFARRVVIVAAVILGQLGLVSWGQHLLVTTDSELLALTGSLFGLLTAVPTSLILLSWLMMLSRARSWQSVPLLITWLQTSLIALGGLAGIVLAIPSTGLTFHNSYLTTGHLHLVALGLVLLSFLAGLIHWWPSFMQRRIAPAAGRAVAITIVVGIMTTYLPMLINGVGGSPKALNVYPVQYEPMHMVSTAGTVILLAGLLGAVWLFARGILGGRLSTQSVRTVSSGEVVFLDIQ